MVQLLLAVIYLSFISLGLPDGLLGAAWPSMYPVLGVDVSFAGILSMLIALGTIVSSLMSDRLTRKIGTGIVTAVSVALTAVSLMLFSVAGSFWVLCFIAIPYGLGAGSVDASLNNYVALHYASRHMSWLHCMWGVGASVGPYIMGAALTGGFGWQTGYRWVGILQIVLTAILLLSLPLWKKRTGAVDETGAAVEDKPLTLRQTVRLPGAKEVLVMFFCYCALEQTAGLWSASYLVLYHGMDAQAAASWASMFFLGITFGRFLSGFLTMRFCDTQMIRLGEGVLALGIGLLFLPLGETTALIGLILVGLGCAPIYPSVIHSTPAHFGADKSQAIIGVQMASAYVGTCLMPPLFGFLAEHITIGLFPVYLLGILVLMAAMHRRLCRVCPTET